MVEIHHCFSTILKTHELLVTHLTAMSEIVRELSQLGWDDNKIGKELGMDSDEVLRLKQINGLQELFADRQYSRAWTVK